MENDINKRCKSFTSLEQSKKLTEILPIKSADMFYRNNGIDVKLMWEHTAQKVESPCWSLAALMDVLDRGALFKTPKGWACQSYIDFKAITSYYYSNPIDACVEMIERLYEQKLL